MRLDLGGIAKGYILEAALHSLRERGTQAALIEAGGDIVVGAPPPGKTGWRIDVPGAGRAFATRAAALRHTALATSGATFQYLERNGTRYSHIIDPRTGLAVTRPILVRVIANDAAVADAIATALSVDPTAADRLKHHFPDVLVDSVTVGPQHRR
jgi:thiamine biosynthesis lipoprotein